MAPKNSAKSSAKGKAKAKTKAKESKAKAQSPVKSSLTIGASVKPKDSATPGISAAASAHSAHPEEPKVVLKDATAPAASVIPSGTAPAVSAAPAGSTAPDAGRNGDDNVKSDIVAGANSAPSANPLAPNILGDEHSSAKPAVLKADHKEDPGAGVSSAAIKPSAAIPAPESVTKDDEPAIAASAGTAASAATATLAVNATSDASLKKDDVSTDDVSTGAADTGIGTPAAADAPSPAVKDDEPANASAAATSASAAAETFDASRKIDVMIAGIAATSTETPVAANASDSVVEESEHALRPDAAQADLRANMNMHAVSKMVEDGGAASETASQSKESDKVMRADSTQAEMQAKMNIDAGPTFLVATACDASAEGAGMHIPEGPSLTASVSSTQLGQEDAAKASGAKRRPQEEEEPSHSSSEELAHKKAKVDEAKKGEERENADDQEAPQKAKEADFKNALADALGAAGLDLEMGERDGMEDDADENDVEDEDMQQVEGDEKAWYAAQAEQEAQADAVNTDVADDAGADAGADADQGPPESSAVTTTKSAHRASQPAPHSSAPPGAPQASSPLRCQRGAVGAAIGVCQGALHHGLWRDDRSNGTGHAYCGRCWDEFESQAERLGLIAPVKLPAVTVSLPEARNQKGAGRGVPKGWRRGRGGKLRATMCGRAPPELCRGRIGDLIFRDEQSGNVYCDGCWSDFARAGFVINMDHPVPMASAAAGITGQVPVAGSIRDLPSQTTAAAQKIINSSAPQAVPLKAQSTSQPAVQTAAAASVLTARMQSATVAAPSSKAPEVKAAPPGWTHHESRTRPGMWYWYHKELGKTQFEHPM